MFKITGLDKLTKDLGDAEKALASIGGELGSISFDPHDPASIELAIQEMEQMIDSRLGLHASNPIVRPLIQGMKDTSRQAILDKAAAARSSEDDTDGE